jgi:hypothetical protein
LKRPRKSESERVGFVMPGLVAGIHVVKPGLRS